MASANGHVSIEWSIINLIRPNLTQRPHHFRPSHDSSNTASSTHHQGVSYWRTPARKPQLRKQENEGAGLLLGSRAGEPPPARLPNLLDDAVDEAVDAIAPLAPERGRRRRPPSPRSRRRRRVGGRPGGAAAGEAEAAQGAEWGREAEHGRGAAIGGPNRRHHGGSDVDRRLSATDGRGGIHIRYEHRARRVLCARFASVEWSDCYFCFGSSVCVEIARRL